MEGDARNCARLILHVFFVFFCTLEGHQRRVNNQEPLPFSFVAISTIIRRRMQVLLAEAAACFINYPGPCRGINATLARRKNKKHSPLVYSSRRSVN